MINLRSKRAHVFGGLVNQGLLMISVGWKELLALLPLCPKHAMNKKPGVESSGSSV